ncbi:Cell growth defect factor 2, partial [Zea mays]
SSRFPFHPRRSSANTSRRSGSPVRSRDGEWLRLRVGPRGGFQRRTRRHLRQVLLHSGTASRAYPFLRPSLTLAPPVRSEIPFWSRLRSLGIVNEPGR